MSKRYIDADALIKDIENCSYETWSKGVNPTWWAQAVKIKDNIKACIERQPTADVVEVVHGEWLKSSPYNRFMNCSVCGFGQNHTNFPYCPMCGAEMSGKRREE